jgi:DeoR/GlpR family transcriptional regulator of sugar metabolism
MNINRRKDILNDIYKAGSVKVSQLAEKYGLNEAAIRRDLRRDLASNRFF